MIERAQVRRISWTSLVRFFGDLASKVCRSRRKWNLGELRLMAGSKRSEIREAMQRRVKRFSAFELLGLEGNTNSPSPSLSQQPADPLASFPEATILTNTALYR